MEKNKIQNKQSSVGLYVPDDGLEKFTSECKAVQ
jgi:hypothetical protein